MDNCLKTVDVVVFMAYNNGFCVPRKDLWDYYAIKERLLMYGYTDEDGRYFLNEKGLEYARNGLSQGIQDRIKRQEEIERLDIQTKSFTRNKQRLLFFFSVTSFVLSILAFLNEFGVFKVIGKELSETLKLICNS